MNKFFVILAGFLLLGSCATAPKYVPYYYNGDKLIYPAIREAIFTNIKQASFDKVDIFNNTFYIKDVWALDGISPRMFDIAIMTSGGMVKYQLQNIRLQDAKTKLWINNSVFLFFNPNTLFARLNDSISKIMDDTVAYDTAKSSALSDQLFLYSAIKDLNEISRKSFIKNELGALSLEVAGSVIDVEEKHTSVDGVDYKYQVSFSQNIGELKGGSYWSSLSSGSLSYRFYTNDISYSTYNRGANIRLLVKIIDGNQSISIDRFFFTVIPAN